MTRAPSRPRSRPQVAPSSAEPAPAAALPEEEEEDAGSRYRAPALAKGLDILELLAISEEPLTLTGIVNRLGRSHGELFRMVQVLQARGYIAQDPASDGYRLTDQLFQLAIHQPHMSNLIEVALPMMRDLAFRAAQSCHMAVQTGGEMIVVARMESAERLGFSVRIGYKRPLAKTASGVVLYAFAPADMRARLEPVVRAGVAPEEFEAFLAEVVTARERGYEQRASSYVAGVLDISAPVMRGESVAGALTMPFLKTLQPVVSRSEAVRMVRETAASISSQLVSGDSRI